MVLCKGHEGARVDGIRWSCVRVPHMCMHAIVFARGQVLVLFNEKLRTCHVHALFDVVGSNMGVGVCTTLGDRLCTLHCPSLH